SIYEVPLTLDAHDLDTFLIERLELQATPERDLAEWRQLVTRAKGLADELTIGVVGKYVELQDAYISGREALHHAGWHHGCRARLRGARPVLHPRVVGGRARPVGAGGAGGVRRRGRFRPRRRRGDSRGAPPRAGARPPLLRPCPGHGGVGVEFRPPRAWLRRA